MPSVRVKFTLKLLVTNLMAIVVVGIIGRGLVLKKFSNLHQKLAFENYQEGIRGYISQYGSWEAAQQVEHFREFETRRMRAQGRPENLPPGRDYVLRPSELSETRPRRPPSEDPLFEAASQPPFIFLLLDPNGRILMGPEEFAVGALAEPSLVDQARPIELNGDIVAQAVPIEFPNLSDLDIGYLDAIHEALIYAFVSAGGLALVLGLYSGNQLSRSLRQLTAAIQAMTPGAMRQQVTIQSNDEVGILAKSFNRMSTELAQAYEDLDHSNRTISQQAVMLKELSIRDALTRLYNRRHFNEQVAQLFTHAKRYGHPLTVAIADIDFFKRINDSFSHATGDEVLRQVARIFHEETRDCDIPARYGGEEFVLAMPDTSIEKAITVCERLRKLIENHPWSHVHADLHVTMSIGLNHDLNLGSYGHMLAAADTKLYEAKRNGRNQLRW